MRKACCLFTGGKDSCYALHIALICGFSVECLLTISPKSPFSWLFHAPNLELVKRIASLLGIPVELYEAGEDELKTLIDALRHVKEKYGIEWVITGALLSEYQRKRISYASYLNGLKEFHPLWQKDQVDYMRELLEHGFEFILTSVSCEGLSKAWLGKRIGKAELDELMRICERYGINPAFEGGEAETLVIKAPFYEGELKPGRFRVKEINKYHAMVEFS